MNGEIKVSYGELASIGSKVLELTETIENLRSNCTAAGNDAVEAGGTSTEVGTLIRSTIADISDEQFKAVLQIIDGFGDALTKVSGLYSDYNKNMVEGIKKIANRRAALLEGNGATSANAQ